MRHFEARRGVPIFPLWVTTLLFKVKRSGLVNLWAFPASESPSSYNTFVVGVAGRSIEIGAPKQKVPGGRRIMEEDQTQKINGVIFNLEN